MTLKIVNTVWKGDFLTPLVLSSLNISLECGIIDVKHQQKQPEQYIIKFDNKSTMLIFKSGKFRVMGNGSPEAVIGNILCVATQLTNVIPNVSMQTMTGVYKYDKRIHLHKLMDVVDGFLDLENFPAVQIKKFKPIHVNVFSSGCVTICGLKTAEFGTVIKDYIDSVIYDCFIS
jgi:TATA-box binding protein (TBP) (component of TFIID and TFIIIB)